MEVLGFKKVRIERISLPGDFRERLESPRIFERAKSVQRFGILSEPMIRERDMRVVYGRDRIASAVRAGLVEIACKLVDCTDDELMELEVTENVQRRHDPIAAQKNLQKLLDVYELQVEETPADKAPLLETRGASRRAKTARGIARVRAGNELGIKPDSVRRKELRARKAELEAKAKREKDEKLVPTPTLNMLGMDIHEQFITDTIATHRLMQRADVHLKSALSALSAVQRSNAPIPAARHQKLYEEIHNAGALLRSHMPVSLCPYCKGLPSLQESCTACIGTGWMSASAAKNVPSELWEEGDKAVVLYRGALTPVRVVLKELRRDEPPAADVLDAEELFA